MKAKRILAFLIAMIMMIGLLPAFAFAEGEADPEQTDEPEVITEVDEGQDEEEPEAPATVEEGEEQDEEEPEAPATVEEGEEQDEEEPEAPATVEEGEKQDEEEPGEEPDEEPDEKAEKGGSKKVVQVSVDQSFITLAKGSDESYQLTWKIYPESLPQDTPVTFTSSNTNVATVDENGVVRPGNTRGHATITATPQHDEGDTYHTDTCRVAVTGGDYTPSGATKYAWVIEQDGTLRIKKTLDTTGVIDFGSFDTSTSYVTSGSPQVGWKDHKTSVTGVSIEDDLYPTQMNSWFHYMNHVTSIDLSRVHFDNVTSMGGTFAQCWKLENIIWPDGFSTANVTNMNSLFNSCRVLPVQNYIGDFDTSSCTNMGYMFSSCHAVETLDLSHFDTSNVTNMASMFYNANHLTTLNTSGWDTSKVTSFNGMFNGCAALTSLDLRHFETDSLTNMSSMFNGCRALTSLQLDPSKFDTSKVTGFSSVFHNCSQLAGINDIISDFDTSSATSMSFMFNGCSQLTAIDVSHFDTSNVTNMANMFSDCTGLTALDISSFDMSNVEDISNMFKGCTGLTSINLGDFNPKLGGIAYSVFMNCSKLTEIDLSGFDPSAATSMYWFFRGCSKLKTIYANDWTFAQGCSTADMFTSCSVLVGGAGTRYSYSHKDGEYARIDHGTSNPGYFTNKADIITAADDDEAVWVIRDNKLQIGTKLVKTGAIAYGTIDLTKAYAQTEVPWAANAADVQTIEVLDNIKPVNMQYWFYGFTNMTSLNIFKIKTDRLVSLKYTFANCSSLTSFLFNSNMLWFDVSNVADFSHMFEGCSSLAQINLDDCWALDATTTLAYMFKDCTSLTTADLTNWWDPWHCTSVEGMFEGCTALTTFIQPMDFNPSAYTNPSDAPDAPFPTSVTNFAKMFKGCNSLTELDLTNFFTDNATNVASMFEGCSNLEKIYAADWAIANDDPSCGANMFLGCAKLTGGSGAVYDADHVDNTYAHLDHWTDHGYFWNEEEPPTVDGYAMILDATGSFNDYIKINFYIDYTDPHNMPEGVKAKLFLTNKKTGEEISSTEILFKDAEYVEGRGYKLSYPVIAKHIEDELHVVLYDAAENAFPFKNKAGTNDYTGVGITYSLLKYVNFLSTYQGNNSAEWQELGKAAKDYCYSASQYFNYNWSEQHTFRDSVAAVTADDLQDYQSKRDGKMPKGVAFDEELALSVMIESDNSFRMFLVYDDNVDPYSIYYAVDDVDSDAVPQLLKYHAGYDKYYLTFTGVYSNMMQLPHTFIIADADHTNTMKVTNVSVLTWVRMIVRSADATDNAKTLAKALFRYNQAALNSPF